MYKNFTNYFGKPPGYAIKFLFIMKIITVIFLTTILQVKASIGFSQTINLSEKNVTLTKILKQIRSQSGYDLVYNTDLISNFDGIDINLKNATVEEAMRKSLANLPLSFLIESKMIIIKRKIAPVMEKEELNFVADTLITGTVFDEKTKQRIPGATITVKNSKLKTQTDKDGNFKILAPKGATLLITYVGYETKQFVTTGNKSIVYLVESPASMKEVVVNGLFTRRAETFTGAASTFSGAELKRVGNQNVIQSLAILDPSFVVTDNLNFGSDPNKIPEIVLRGASGIPDLTLNAQYSNAPNLPLFILDGFETTVQKVYDLNMNMVASITLLKDASAKAIYGSKAGNGVVVIETLRPVAGQLRVSYSGSLDITAPDLSSYHMTNALQKIQAEVLADKYYSPYPELQFPLTEQYTANMKQALGGLDTYWLSQPLQNGVGQKHNLYLDGGTEAMRYSAGVNYNNVTGVMKGSDRTTISGLVNLTYRKNNFSFTNNLSIDQNKAINSPYGNFAQYTTLNPYWRINDDNGNLIPFYTIGSSTKVFNPLYNASLNTKDNSKYTNITENFYGEWEAVKNLRFTARVGISSQNNSTEFFLPASHTNFAQITVTSPEYLNRGEYTITNGRSNNISSDFGVAYSFQTGKSQLFTNLLYSIQQSSMGNNGMTMVGFPNDKLDDISLGKQYRTGSKATGTESTSRNMGVTSSVNYSYDNRFLADVSIRANASSQFGANKRWGTFWSTGLGWNVHHEEFMKSIHFVNQFKIRGSVGSSGTQNFSSYQSIASYNYITDVTYNGDLGLKLLALANPNLKWQQSLDKNIGVDASLFNSVSLGFDYYIKDTKDLLSDQTVAPSSGFAMYKENVGETRNNGYQINMNTRLYNNTASRIFISVFANVSHNTNKVRKVSNALKKLNDKQDAEFTPTDPNLPVRSKPTTRFTEGQSITAIWAVPSMGIDPGNGKEIFVKKDGTLSYIWSAADQVVVGDALAKFNGSFGSNVQYKGLSVNFAFSYRLGGQLYNATLVSKVENADINKNVDVRLLEGRWKTPGQQALFKDIKDLSVTRPSSRFVQNNSELIFSSVNLSYDFSKLKFVKAMKMNSLSATVNLGELGRIGSVKTERGLDYPFARNMSLSLQANF